VSIPIVSDKLILGNPLIRRYRYSLFRRSHLWVYLTIYTSVVLLLLFVNVSIRDLGGEAVAGGQFFRRLYHQFVMIEIVILWGWCTLNSKSALPDEVANKTYDFFRLLPLSALQKTLGILVGRNLLSLLFAVVTLGPMTLFGLLGGVDLPLQIQIVLVLLSIALCTNAVVLLSSSTSPKRQGKTGPGVWLLLMVLSIPFFLGPFFASLRELTQSYDTTTHRVAFYTIDVPLLPLIICVALYFGFWCVLGLLRKFTFEGAALFNRPGAVLFLLGYELLVLGLFLPHLPGGAVPQYFLWLVVSLLAVVLIPVGSINDCGVYLERSGRPAAHAPDRNAPWRLWRHSNLTLGLGLLAVWIVFFVVAGRRSGVSPRQLAQDTVTLLSFYALLLLLLEVYVVYEPVFGKMGILVAFLVLLDLFLPLLLAGTLQMPSLRFYSPFAFFIDIGSSGDVERNASWVSILAVNFGLSLIPALVVWRRYGQILALRRAM